MVPKKCEGFHPDYCLVWTNGPATYHLLLCFGCHEMKLHGPGQELLVDIRQRAFEEFKIILMKYRDQRPKRDWTKTVCPASCLPVFAAFEHMQ